MGRVEKAVKEYEAFQKTTQRGGLFMRDAAEGHELNLKADGHVDLFGAIYDAMEAGFMIGYKCAKREGKA